MSKGRILVAEDRAEMAVVVEAMLEDLGFDVDLATDGGVAVQKAREHHYAAILMDIEMPVLDGLQATEIIRRQDGPTGQAPIIGVTGHSTTGMRHLCLRAGMTEFLIKPFTIEQLDKTLTAHVAAAPDGG